MGIYLQRAGDAYDEATQVAVSPDGERVYVAGVSSLEGAQSIQLLGDTIFTGGYRISGSNSDYQVVALEDDRKDHTATMSWVQTHSVTNADYPAVRGLGVTPTTVVVTGTSTFGAMVGPCGLTPSGRLWDWTSRPARSAGTTTTRAPAAGITKRGPWP